MAIKKKTILLFIGAALLFSESSFAAGKCLSFCISTPLDACHVSSITKKCQEKCPHTFNFDLYCQLKQNGMDKQTAAKISIYTDKKDQQKNAERSQVVIDFLNEIQDPSRQILPAKIKEFFETFANSDNPLLAINNQLERADIKERNINLIAPLQESSAALELSQENKLFPESTIKSRRPSVMASLRQKILAKSSGGIKKAESPE